MMYWLSENAVSVCEKAVIRAKKNRNSIYNGKTQNIIDLAK